MEQQGEPTICCSRKASVIVTNVLELSKSGGLAPAWRSHPAARRAQRLQMVTHTSLS
jgi:hypothetical protein